MATPPVFSAGAVLTASQMNAVGMWKVAEVDLTTGGSVNVNNCFTSDFSNYRILVRDAKHATTSVNLLLRLRVGGVDTATGYYWSRRFIPMGGAGGGDTGASNGTDIVPGIVAGVSNAGAGSIDIYNPQKAAVTSCTFQGIWTVTTGESSMGSGFLNNTTVYDGFSLLANTGNFTSLNVCVYGYRD